VGDVLSVVQVDEFRILNHDLGRIASKVNVPIYKVFNSPARLVCEIEDKVVVVVRKQLWLLSEHYQAFAET